MQLRTIIADDEPLARERLRHFLEGEEQVRILAECNTGAEAVSAIEDHDPDLVFLDVQMPDLDGFGVLKKVNGGRSPAVVFVTAFDRYAARAFEEEAVDYVLKPFDRERVHKALERAVEHYQRRRIGEIDDHLDELLELARERSGERYPDRLTVRHGGSVTLVRVEDVDWIEAARNYVKIHAGGDCHTMRETLSHLESQLDPEQFLRIHRSTLVNVDRIQRIRPGYGSESVAELRDGTRLVISRACRRGRVREVLG